MYLSDPRFQVAAARRILHNEGCESGVGGQVSVRDPEVDAFWTSPWGYFGETTPYDIRKLDFNCEPLEGGNLELGSSPAVGFHAEIYRQRPDVNAVVHTHSLWAMVLSTSQATLGVYNDVAAVFDGQQAQFTPDPAYSMIDAKLIAAALGDKSLLILRNHGIVVVDGSVEAATGLAVTFEEMARVHVEAERIGGAQVSHELFDQVRTGHRNGYIPQTWAANIRQLRRSDPDLFDFVIDSELRAHGYLGAN